MKPNIPRTLAQLSPSEKKRIYELADAQISKNVGIILDIYIKMSCAVLHDAFGFGEKRLTAYLGNYRRLFKRHAKWVKQGTQLEELDKQMLRIFRKGYPDEFFKSMISDWSVKTEGQDETPR
jgi:hypothetical protein